MAQLDDTITNGQTGHISDHQQLAKKANYVFDVKDYGAVGDGTTDDTTAIQAALDAAKVSGGEVTVPPGTFIHTGLTIASHVYLIGSGAKATTLKMKGSTNASSITSDSFASLTGQNKWFVSESVPVGFAIKHLRIDGNKTNNLTSGHGLALYGKRYVIEDVLIHDCRDNGIYSECGNKGGQTETDDLPESSITKTHTRACGAHGIEYRGPHDGYLDEIYTSSNGGTGIYIRTDSSTYNGGCTVGFAHTYSNDIGAETDVVTQWGELITESNNKQGLIVGAVRSIVGSIYAFKNWNEDAVGGTAQANANIAIQQECLVNNAFIRTDNGGTGILITGTGVKVGNAFIEGMNTDGLGISINGNRATIQCGIKDFDASGGVGIEYGASAAKHAVIAIFDIATSETGFKVTNAGSRSTLIGTISGGTTRISGSLAGGVGSFVRIATDNSTDQLAFDSVEINGALNHDGSTVGFYGTAPVSKQTSVAVTAAGIHAALVNLGLITA